jgi:hypothetical protein
MSFLSQESEAKEDSEEAEGSKESEPEEEEEEELEDPKEKLEEGQSLPVHIQRPRVSRPSSATDLKRRIATQWTYLPA